MSRSLLIRSFAFAALAVVCIVWIVGPSAQAQGEEEPPKLESEEAKQIEALYKEYFESKDDARRAEILKELDEWRELSARDYDKFVKLALKLTKVGPRLDGRSPFKHPDLPGNYILSGAGGGKRGLVIGLHGGGSGSAKHDVAAGKWGAPKGHMGIYPQVMNKTDGAWNNFKEEEMVLQMINAAKRTYNIDTNRVYVVGHSMGAWGTWAIGGHNADLFAALGCGAGGLPGSQANGVAGGILANLYNTPIYWWHSTDDKNVSVLMDQLAAKEMKRLKEEHPKGYKHIYKEYDNLGHGFEPGGTRNVWNFVLKNRRDPNPKKIVFQPPTSWQDERPSKSPRCQNFWLKAYSGTIVAEQTGKNEFTVDKSSGFTIFLNKKNCDLKKDVVVKSGDRELHNGPVKLSLSAILETIERKQDPELVYVARLDF